MLVVSASSGEAGTKLVTTVSRAPVALCWAQCQICDPCMRIASPGFRSLQNTSRSLSPPPPRTISAPPGSSVCSVRIVINTKGMES